MSHGTVADRLRRARRRRLVGRAGELELLRGALEAPVPPFAVLFLHGPGGVGKTALLELAADLAEEAGVPAWRLDLRGVQPSPPAFEAALAAALGTADLAPLRAPGRRVLLLDTFERASGLEPWLRDEFLTALGEDTLVVIAGRDPPGADWLADAGWHELLRVVALRNLPYDDARGLLRAGGVEEALHDRICAVTHGHPLALALLVDLHAERGGAPATSELAGAPDVVRVLLERFVDAVPSPRHRAALEVCAHLRATTEDALRGALEGDDAAALFGWLRRLCFVEEGADGLFPHDLARDVLDADLRWRDPAAYADLHRRVRRQIIARIRATEGREQQRASADLHFMHHSNPGIRPFYDWESLGKDYTDRLREGDAEPLLAMVERHETPESAALAAHWLERQPGAFLVFRSAGETAPVGFAAILALHAAAPEDIAADPGAAAMWAYALAHGAPLPGDEVHAGRWFMDAAAYQAPSRSFNLIAVDAVQRYVSRPRLAWDFVGMWAQPEAIAPFMRHIDYHDAPSAGYEVGGRRYGVFAHDWRRMPLEPWLELMTTRELADAPGGDSAQPPPALALAQAEFGAAVRHALRDLRRPDRLAANPLTRTRVVQERTDAGPAGVALAALLREAVGALADDPRDEKLHRVLDRTYLRPAPTQERAAELLGLPLSTYRRHLARGVERVVGWLWQRELYGSRMSAD
jgi:hypothetical protein